MNARRPPGRLHVLTDTPRPGARDLLASAAAALEGGAEVLQYRDKSLLAEQERIRVGRELGRLVRQAGRIWIVNDHPDVALACAADGVHLGRNDGSVEQARRRLGPQALVGATANSLAEALRLARAPVDYLGVGPVFGTRSKCAPAPTLGLDGLREIVAAVRLPVIAIGNITAPAVGAVLDTGAHGVAVLSAVMHADDARRATRELVQALAAWLRRSA